MTTHEHIEQIVESTFKVLKEVHSKQKEGYNQYPSGNKSRIIFRQYSKEYRNRETRLSEQELRFIFVEQFNKYCDNKLSWFYSVETPTEHKYIFSERGVKNSNPNMTDNKGEGQSAMVDFAIHDETLKRIALVEFKALNPHKLSFIKDFKKLNAEPVENTYFIMYIKSYDSGTINNLKLKVKSSIGKAKFYCYDLESCNRIDVEILK
jgi:hypothetical protein